MFLQGRVIIVWLSWLIGGICGVVILLVVICYCRLMPRHQKSFDEQYLKENYKVKENHTYASQDNYKVVKHAEVQVQRHARPASYAGGGGCGRRPPAAVPAPPPRDARASARDLDAHYASSSSAGAEPRGGRGVRPATPRGCAAPPPRDARASARDLDAHYASSSMLDDIEGATSMDALKTRSLPAFLRPKPRPLSTEDDVTQLYAKVNLSKKYKNRMRSEHAAIIALSKSHSQFFDADAVIVYDQRTAL